MHAVGQNNELIVELSVAKHLIGRVELNIRRKLAYNADLRWLR